MHTSIKKGFSLLELIIYLAITIVVMVVLAESVVVMLRARERNLANREVQQNLRFAMSRIERALTQATAVTGTYPGNTLALTISSDTTTFRVSGGVLQIQEGAAGSFIDLTTSKVTVGPIATNMFTKISNAAPAKDSIQVQLKIDYVTGGKTSLTASASAQTTVELRQI